MTEEQSAAVQEYIDTLRAFAARQDSGPALAQVEQEMAALGKRKDKLLDLVLAGALSSEEFKQRNEQLAALEERCSSLQNAEQTLAERIRRVENLRRTIEEQWQANCGFSREMSKALVNRIVVDADENKTCISLDVFLTAGRESCTDPVLPAASQASDAPLKMTFPRPRSGHQGGYEVTYCVRRHLD